jgi:hypothetical protein
MPRNQEQRQAPGGAGKTARHSAALQGSENPPVNALRQVSRGGLGSDVVTPSCPSRFDLQTPLRAKTSARFQGVLVPTFHKA